MDRYFLENQQLLLEIVNTTEGRELLETLGPKIENQIVLVTQNSFHELIGFKDKTPLLKATFFSRHPILELFAPIIEKMKIIATSKYLDAYLEDKHKAFLHCAGIEKNKKLPQIFLTQATFNPTAGSVSPVDGWVGRDGVNETWATIIAGVGLHFSNVGTSGNDTPGTICSTTSNQFQAVFRNIFCFDTSTLTASAIISSATFGQYINSANYKSNQLGNPDWHLCSTTPASTSTLAATDYSNFGSTSFGSVAYASYTNAQYNNITLNASGLANISQTGISKFGTRISWDILASFGGVWAGNAQSSYRGNQADDGSNIPALTVTYTLPGGLWFAQI